MSSRSYRRTHTKKTENIWGPDIVAGDRLCFFDSLSSVLYGTSLDRVVLLWTFIHHYTVVTRPEPTILLVYYESIKRELNRRLIYECRCDERLKAKTEGSTRLEYTTDFSHEEKKIQDLLENCRVGVP